MCPFSSHHIGNTSEDNITVNTKFFDIALCLQGAPIKNSLEETLYFSHSSMDLSQAFYVSIHTRYPANFIEITGIVSQIPQFKL